MEIGSYNENKSEKREKQKVCLFIDDGKLFLDSLERFFSDKKNVFFAECHSKEEALAAILKHRPNIVFIDNDLSGKNQNDGIEVIDSLRGKDIRFYSITSSNEREILNEYAKRGVEVLGKSNIVRLIEIIESKDE
jgi:ActR/RegA family two-component response regulator